MGKFGLIFPGPDDTPIGCDRGYCNHHLFIKKEEEYDDQWSSFLQN